MASCKGLVCTAGFESVCEAMYLDKPVMMVPVKGHYEQYCNALDSSRIGAGIYAEEFDLARISGCVDQYKKEKNVAYREWVDSFERRAFQEIMLADPQINQPKKLHMKGSLSYILAILSGVKKLIP
jgi:UDP:flavonoid glycosyltransferase YjiC (YdhE family)